MPNETLHAAIRDDITSDDPNADEALGYLFAMGAPRTAVRCLGGSTVARAAYTNSKEYQKQENRQRNKTMESDSDDDELTPGQVIAVGWQIGTTIGVIGALITLFSAPVAAPTATAAAMIKLGIKATIG